MDLNKKYNRVSSWTRGGKHACSGSLRLLMLMKHSGIK